MPATVRNPSYSDPTLGSHLSNFFSALIDNFRGKHAADRENEHADENFIGLESRAGDGDHEADAGRGGIELSHHHADQSPSDRQPEAGEYKRHG